MQRSDRSLATIAVAFWFFFYALAYVFITWPATGCVEDPSADDDTSVEDDDDTVTVTSPIGIATDIYVGDLDNALWPEVETTIDDSTRDGALYVVPADELWHTVASRDGHFEGDAFVPEGRYDHAACDVKVAGDVVKVRVEHHADYATFYPGVADGGHWNGEYVEFELEEGDTLVIPLNLNVAGSWQCQVGPSISNDTVVMVMGERAQTFFNGVAMHLNGHRAIGENSSGDEYNGVFGDDIFSGTLANSIPFECQ